MKSEEEEEEEEDMALSRIVCQDGKSVCVCEN